MNLPQSIFASVVVAQTASAATLEQSFQTDPRNSGWQVFGDKTLFHWDSAARVLDVTWDSSKPNSYFYAPLGTTLAKSDRIELSFDLVLEDVMIGVDPDRQFTFQIAVGLLKLSDATSPSFIRGTGSSSPNLLEFNYFPDSGFGPTLSPVMVSSNNQFVPGFTVPFELSLGDSYHFEMKFDPVDQTLRTTAQRSDETFFPAKDVKLGASFTDFQLDAVAVSSYSHQDAGGSILAHGTIDNIRITFPTTPQFPLIGKLDQGTWQVSFQGQPDWVYTLERTLDWREWKPVTPPSPGTGSTQVLHDGDLPLPPVAWYRVRAERQ